MTVYSHPGLVLGGRRPGGGQAGAGDFNRDHSGGQVGAGGSLPGLLHRPTKRLFLTCEDELARRLAVCLAGPCPSNFL